MEGPAVAVEQLLLGGAVGLVRAGGGLADQRPQGLDAAQAVVQVVHDAAKRLRFPRFFKASLTATLKNPAELPEKVEQRGRNREEAVQNTADLNRGVSNVKKKRRKKGKGGNRARRESARANGQLFGADERGFGGWGFRTAAAAGLAALLAAPAPPGLTGQIGIAQGHDQQDDREVASPYSVPHASIEAVANADW